MEKLAWILALAFIAVSCSVVSKAPLTVQVASVTSRSVASSPPVSAYAENVRQQLDRSAASYLEAHDSKSLTAGTVKVRFTIAFTGDVTAIHVIESSTDPQLDQAVVDIVRSSGGFQPFPAALRAVSRSIVLDHYFRFSRHSGP